MSGNKLFIGTFKAFKKRNIGSMLFCMGNNKSGSKPCNHGYFIFKLFHPFGVYDF